MLIRFKSLEHEVIGDAPFIGARLSSIGCSINCNKCQNQWMKELPTKQLGVHSLVKVVEANPYNQGIILGGLEWTDQPEELVAILEAFSATTLQVMLYTGYTEEECYQIRPEIFSYNIWVKFGQYIHTAEDSNNVQNGVKLASKNQFIKYLG